MSPRSGKRDKNVIRAKEPSKGKQASIPVDPNNYKNLHIAWRFGQIDEASDWGINSFCNQITLHLDEDSVMSMMEGALSDDSFYNAAIRVSKTKAGSPGKEYNGLSHLMKRLTERVKGSIDPQDLHLISHKMEFDFFYVKFIAML